jgi:4-amino-4-deoxy-L-arabinose transferase-like glycosyltransferase
MVARRADAAQSIDKVDARLALFAATVSGVYWAIFQRHYRPMSDANHYNGIARNLAAGRGFSHPYPAIIRHSTAFRPPAFPSLLAGVYRVFGDRVFVGQCLNLLLGVVVVLLVRRVGALIGGRSAGIAAAVIVAVYPPLVANNVVLLSEPLGLCVLLGVVLCLVRNRLTLAAVLSGLLCLTWTSGQGFFVVVLLWVLWRCGWRRALRFGLIGFVVVVPWMIRNEIQVGTPALVTSDGFNLAAVYSPETQHAHVVFLDPAFNKAFDSWQFRLVQFHEAAWDALLRRTGWQGIKANPVHIFWVASQNSERLVELNQSANIGADRIDGRNMNVRRYSMPVFYLVTVVGVIGMWRLRSSQVLRLLMVLAGYFSLASIFTVFSPRLRAVFDLTCCIATGALIAQIRLERRRPAAVPGGMALSEQERATGLVSP